MTRFGLCAVQNKIHVGEKMTSRRWRNRLRRSLGDAMNRSIIAFAAAGLVASLMTSATFADDKPDPQTAAQMSLGDAKYLIQKWLRYSWSDLSADMVGQYAVEFGPVQMMDYYFPRDGVPTKSTICPYESFEPYVDSHTQVEGSGAHKGEVMSSIISADEDGSGCLRMGTSAASHDTAMQVAAAMLRWKNSTLAERQAFLTGDQAAFAPVVAAYQASKPRPQISEDVHRSFVMAEAAVQDKRFADAVDDFEDGIKIAPWWPEGHFNEAIILGELHYYDEAIAHMKKYVALVPDAPNARAAQDKIYVWEGERQALPQQESSAPPAQGER